MSPRIIGRQAEEQAISGFLTAAAEPCVLLLEGEAGIGKTTLLGAATERATAGGFRVFAARTAPAESAMAYGSLADLLAGVDDAEVADLPDPQRRAVDRVLLRSAADGGGTDQRAVAAAFLALVRRAARTVPVLLALDDLQWLDPSSRTVLAFAASRLSGRVAVIATVRTETGPTPVSWLRIPQPERVIRLQVPPLTMGGVHAVVSERLGRPFARPTLQRIQEISRGNPFYALELARATESNGAEVPLPDTLTELVRARIDGFSPETQHVLLATACLAAPTLDVVATAVSSSANTVVGLLEEAEGKGVVVIDGLRLRFAHPLLARGVYTHATPARLRAMHKTLAGIVDEPELRARHLALAATSRDSDTLEALDAAADSAHLRGAPAAAAEFVDLAIRLGGDTPERRIRSARHHADAGDPGRAREMLEDTVATLQPGGLRAQALALLGYVRLLTDSFLEATSILERAAGEAGEDIALRVLVLLTMALSFYNAGQLDAAVKVAEDAVKDAAPLGESQLLSQALGMRVVAKFARGDGIDEAGLQRALELEDREAHTALPLRPRMQYAQLCSWTGQLDIAHYEMGAIRQRCIDRGEEGELMYVAFQSVLLEVWRANFAEAALIAEDAMERALQLGGDTPLCMALTMKAMLAAYVGRVDEARASASEAIAATERCGSPMLAEGPMMMSGFLEVSLGNYEAALTTLEPLLYKFDAVPKGTELAVAFFVPDAVEAMIHVGRLADADPLIERLETNGRRLDRPWMLAISARCRALLLAANKDVDGALASVTQAMVEHDRLPMPFERARTQLLLGQLQRRQRQKDSATTTLGDALAAFETLGTPLWAERARTELARVSIRSRSTLELTPSEQRVAELAATGMTNREVAAALFISPKTVEVNLSRIYRKLGIHSRAELGRRMRTPNT